MARRVTGRSINVRRGATWTAALLICAALLGAAPATAQESEPAQPVPIGDVVADIDPEDLTVFVDRPEFESPYQYGDDPTNPAQLDTPAGTMVSGAAGIFWFDDVSVDCDDPAQLCADAFDGVRDDTWYVGFSLTASADIPLDGSPFLTFNYSFPMTSPGAAKFTELGQFPGDTWQDMTRVMVAESGSPFDLGARQFDPATGVFTTPMSEAFGAIDGPVLWVFVPVEELAAMGGDFSGVLAGIADIVDGVDRPTVENGATTARLEVAAVQPVADELGGLLGFAIAIHVHGGDFGAQNPSTITAVPATPREPGDDLRLAPGSPVIAAGRLPVKPPPTQDPVPEPIDPPPSDEPTPQPGQAPEDQPRPNIPPPPAADPTPADPPSQDPDSIATPPADDPNGGGIPAIAWVPILLAGGALVYIGVRTYRSKDDEPEPVEPADEPDHDADISRLFDPELWRQAFGAVDTSETDKRWDMLIDREREVEYHIRTGYQDLAQGLAAGFSGYLETLDRFNTAWEAAYAGTGEMEELINEGLTNIERAKIADFVAAVLQIGTAGVKIGISASRWLNAPSKLPTVASITGSTDEVVAFTSVPDDLAELGVVADDLHKVNRLNLLARQVGTPLIDLIRRNKYGQNIGWNAIEQSLVSRLMEAKNLIEMPVDEMMVTYRVVENVTLALRNGSRADIPLEDMQQFLTLARRPGFLDEMSRAVNITFVRAELDEVAMAFRADQVALAGLIRDANGVGLIRLGDEVGSPFAVLDDLTRTVILRGSGRAADDLAEQGYRVVQAGDLPVTPPPGAPPAVPPGSVPIGAADDAEEAATGLFPGRGSRLGVPASRPPGAPPGTPPGVGDLRWADETPTGFFPARGAPPAARTPLPGDPVAQPPIPDTLPPIPDTLPPGRLVVDADGTVRFHGVINVGTDTRKFDTPLNIPTDTARYTTTVATPGSTLRFDRVLSSGGRTASDVPDTRSFPTILDAPGDNVVIGRAVNAVDDSLLTGTVQPPNLLWQAVEYLRWFNWTHPAGRFKTYIVAGEDAVSTALELAEGAIDRITAQREDGSVARGNEALNQAAASGPEATLFVLGPEAVTQSGDTIEDRTSHLIEVSGDAHNVRSASGEGTIVGTYTPISVRITATPTPVELTIDLPVAFDRTDLQMPLADQGLHGYAAEVGVDLDQRLVGLEGDEAAAALEAALADIASKRAWHQAYSSDTAPIDAVLDYTRRTVAGERPEFPGAAFETVKGWAENQGFYRWLLGTVVITPAGVGLPYTVADARALRVALETGGDPEAMRGRFGDIERAAWTGVSRHNSTAKPAADAPGDRGSEAGGDQAGLFYEPTAEERELLSQLAEASHFGARQIDRVGISEMHTLFGDLENTESKFMIQFLPESVPHLGGAYRVEGTTGEVLQNGWLILSAPIENMTNNWYTGQAHQAVAEYLEENKETLRQLSGEFDDAVRSLDGLRDAAGDLDAAWHPLGTQAYEALEDVYGEMRALYDDAPEPWQEAHRDELIGIEDHISQKIAQLELARTAIGDLAAKLDHLHGWLSGISQGEANLGLVTPEVLLRMGGVALYLRMALAQAFMLDGSALPPATGPFAGVGPYTPVVTVGPTRTREDAADPEVAERIRREQEAWEERTRASDELIDAGNQPVDPSEIDEIFDPPADRE